MSEIPEQAVGAPFSGIQSEMTAADVEKVNGFLDCQDVLLWNGRARNRPVQKGLPSFGESVLGTASFYDANGDRHQISTGPTTLKEYIPSTNSWNNIPGLNPHTATGILETTGSSTTVTWEAGAQFVTGGSWNGLTITIGGTVYTIASVTDPTTLVLTAPFAGGTGSLNFSVSLGAPFAYTLNAGSNLYSFAVVGYKLCFANGVDNIQVWDGISPNFQPASDQSFPARFLMELNTHLVSMSTIESGVPFVQRVRWSGANDPTDWVSFDSGIEDILSDIGPLYGGAKIGQQGALIHADGVTQMIPTGIGTQPFYFFPLGSSEHGCGFPYTIVSLPDFGIFYVAKDNVYLLDTSFNFNSIGSMKSGGFQLGARSAILAELQKAPVDTVSGFACVAINGNDYLSYWIVIPGLSTWIFNISEGNWTRWTWGPVPNLQVAGRLYNDTSLPWSQLVGAWSQQNSSWAALNTVNPFDFVFLGYSDGTCNYIDFTGSSEQGFTIAGPRHCFGDRRHVKILERFRIVYEDLGPFVVDVLFSTESGATDEQTVVAGSGSGLIFDEIVNTQKLSGVYLSWTVSGSNLAGPASFTEFAPLYVTGGEYKNNP